MDRVHFVISVLLGALLASNIVIAIVSKKVSITSFVCVALIAMMQLGENMLNNH